MKTKLYLTNELFDLTVIQHAAADYGHLAHIAISQRGKDWVITFRNCKYDPDRTVKEFENYLIGLANQ